MLFNSITYVVFLIVFSFLYYLLPKQPRLWLVFVSSMFFYGLWRPEFLLLMLFSIYVDYFAGLALFRYDKIAVRRLILFVSLSVNFGLLLYFKYLNFVLENVSYLFGEAFTPLDIILPLGISFYTFQSVSYTVDVYRRTIPPERNFLVYGCFVLFFPQLVAGPILRAGEVIWQLGKEPLFAWSNLYEGTKRILFGLALKVLFADNIGPLVDAGFETPSSSLSAIDVWTLAFLFGFQIYFDFSAYSHIAIGSARIIGFDFPENFAWPYLAKTPKEFWKRWHISLSSWIRDYLYLPLLGKKSEVDSKRGLEIERSGSNARTRALVLTWIIMGFWHGANWTFGLWGVWHAMLILGFRQLEKWKINLPDYFSWPLTLGLVMLGWIPFRAASLSQAFEMFGLLLTPSGYLFLGMRENTYLVAALSLLLFLTAYQLSQLKVSFESRVPNFLGLPLRTFAWCVIISLVVVFLRPVDQFIYFQF